MEDIVQWIVMVYNWTSFTMNDSIILLNNWIHGLCNEKKGHPFKSKYIRKICLDLTGKFKCSTSNLEKSFSWKSYCLMCQTDYTVVTL
jgi:hypothetical protein